MNYASAQSIGTARMLTYVVGVMNQCTFTFWIDLKCFNVLQKLSAPHLSYLITQHSSAHYWDYPLQQ
jgi:hypothetical protein